jgi:hypothetical protein
MLVRARRRILAYAFPFQGRGMACPGRCQRASRKEAQQLRLVMIRMGLRVGPIGCRYAA